LTNAAPTKRIYGLDILRAMAIFFVMSSHSYEYSKHALDVKYYSFLIMDGVGLFFVLSGFLVGGILIRTARDKECTSKELLRFWTRRWLRTLPNYFLVLLLLVGAYWHVHKALPPRLFQYFTFTQCFASPHPLFFGEAWSLAVEEWFYLVVPAALFVVLYFSKGNRRHILSLIVFVLVAGTLIRVFKVAGHNYFADGSFGEEISKQVVTRMDGIMYGMLGAWLSIYKPAQWMKHRNTLFISGILLLIGSRIGVTYSLFFYGYFFYTSSAVGTLCLLPKLSTITAGKGVVYKIFTFISAISYSMYLTNHMIVERGIMPPLLKAIHLDASQGAVQSALVVMLFWTLTIIISYLLYRFWEQPMMRLRDKWKPPLRKPVLWN
jgi:peptidoglycan/LPS O-acetylase OafA/YrhL